MPNEDTTKNAGGAETGGTRAKEDMLNMCMSCCGKMKDKEEMAKMWKSCCKDMPAPGEMARMWKSFHQADKPAG